MGNGHSHAGHSHAIPTGVGRSRALTLSFLANAVLLVGMIVATIAFGSLAVLADAAHQLTDVFGLALALIAFRLAKRPSSPSFTWGFRRSEVLGALANAVLLLASGVWILFEASQRLDEPPEINGAGVIAIALIGLAVNGFSARSIVRVSGDNLNLRGAAIHLLADAAGSAAVLVSGITAYFWDVHWVDLVASILIAVLVLWTGWRLLVETVRVLLEGTPSGMEIDELTKAMLSNADVSDVHHLHVWSLDGEHTALSAHLVVDRETLHDAQAVADTVRQELEVHHNIAHATLAIECHACDGEGAHIR